MPGSVAKAPLKVSEFYTPRSQSAAWQSSSQGFGATLFGSWDFATGLVSYWKLDETSGTRNDSFGTNHLTDHNSVGSTAGLVGNCAGFTAASSTYLSCTSNSTLQMSGNTDFTIAFWVQLKSVVAQSFVTKDDDAANSRDYTVDFTLGAGIRFYIKGGGTYLVNAGGATGTGVWYFVVAWYDSANGQLHLRLNDGITYNSAGFGATGTDVSAAEFRIGAREYAANEDYADAYIDEVAIWKRLLTPTEITALWNSGAGTTYGAKLATLTRLPRKSLTATLAPVAAIIRKITDAGFTATLSFVGAITKRSTRKLTAALSFVGTFAKNFIAGGILYLRSFTATLFSSGLRYTDDFNRGSLGANWTTDSASFSALSIVSNTCQGSTASAHNVAIYNASGTIPADQYAQCKVTATGGFIGLVLRSDGAGTFYVCYYSAGSATMYKWTAGSSGGFATGSTITPAVNDVIYFEAVGSAMTMKVNGVTVCTGTEGAITGAGYSGIDIYDNLGAVDDFESGTIGGGGPSATLTKRTGKALGATWTPVAALARKLGRALTATLSFVGALTRKTSRALTATLSFIGTFAKTFIAGGGHVFTQSMTASLSFAGITIKQTRKSASAILDWNKNLGPPETMLASAIPSTNGAGGPYAVGARVKFLSAGQISAVLLYHWGTDTTSSRTIYLWPENGATAPGSPLLTVTSTETPSVAAWVTTSLATPFNVTLNQEIRVSYDTGAVYSYTGPGTSSAPHIQLVTSVWNTVGTYPQQSDAANYWVDVVFQPGAPLFPLLKRIVDSGFVATLIMNGSKANKFMILAATKFAATQSFTGLLTASKSFLKSLTATLSFVGSVTARIIATRAFTATLSFAGASSRRANKAFTATLNFVSALVKRITDAGFTATLSFIGNVVPNFISGAGHVFTQSFDAALAFVGLFVKLPLKNFAASLFLPPPAFDPTTISSLKYRYKADSLALSDGDPVATWPDSTGSGYNLGATGAEQPTFKIIRPGRAVVRFDGVADRMYNVASSGVVPPNTIFAVVNYTTKAGVANQLYAFYTGGNQMLGINTNAVFQIYGGGSVILDTKDISGAVHCLTAVYSGGNMSGYLDGYLRLTGAAPAVSMLNVAIMSNPANTVHSIGDALEFMVFNAALSGADLDNLHDYAQNYYGIIGARLTKRTTRKPTGTLSWIGNIAIGKFFTRAFTAILNATAALQLSTSKAFSATLSAAASLVKRITRTLSGTLSFVGSTVKAIRDAGFTATLSFVGNLVGIAVHFFTRAFTATLSFSATLTRFRLVQRVLTATLAFSGSMQRRIAKSLSATLAFSGAVRKAIRKVFAPVLSFIGFIFRGGAVTVLAGWITKCLASIGVTGSTTKVVRAESHLTVEKLDESGMTIQTTGSKLTVERTK